MSQSKVQGSLCRAQGPASLAKEMKLGLGVAHGAARRGNMLSRATRVKVWEERIDEEAEELGRDDQQQVERLRVQHQQFAASNGIKSKQVRSSMQMQIRGQQAVLAHGSRSKTKAINGAEEIGVFDAERYFGTAEQPAAGWAREEEDELMEGEAGGDLPLSPLVEFGKGQSWRWRSEGVAPNCAAPLGGRGTAPWAAASAALGSSSRRRRVESSEFTSPRTSNASSLSEVEPLQRTIAHTLLNPSSASASKRQGKNKVQPASPSGRLANFLAKFKASTPRKSPAPTSPASLQPPTSASTPPPRSRTPAASTAASCVVSPAKKIFPHYSPGLHPHATAHSSSPRGRFLRAFSSSSADNAPSALSLRYHSTMKAASTPASMPVASSPVSPAARSAPDLYSPIAHHTAATTPNSSRLPRSGAHSANYSQQYQYGSKSNRTTSINRADSAAIAHCNSSSGSLKQQLPFLSRKLKVYLMPDKAAQSGKHEKSSAGMKTAAQGHEFNGATPGQLLNAREVQGTAKLQRRLRWLHAEDQVVDEDIELAERLLRVVQDHQSIGLAQHSKISSLNQISTQTQTNNNMASANGNYLYVDGVSEYSSRKYDQMHPSKISAASNLVPHPYPHSHPHPHATAVQYSGNGAVVRGAGAGPHLQYFMSNPDLQLPASAKLDQEGASQQQLHYDSDSSSDLFEIETPVGMGLYSRRDLPVYEAKEAPFPNHSSFSFAKPGTAR
ncbi:hypothetical protein GOP47_0006592 [Adiantum capillus-veneris]|uniref:Uncharacterized protein n=1 Tax=Adiantum capillus-veneris TaxID=13818 RepID=A0A9D4V3X3_ADICA|nr:hypothetical protein GOP47_0006592 [Adiantum capillus-veneris]